MCLSCNTSPLNRAVGPAMTILSAVMGFVSVFLARFGREEVLPTSLYSAFHSSFHHLGLLTTGIWLPEVPCGQVAWTDFPFKHYLVHLNAWVFQRCSLSLTASTVVNFSSSSHLLLGTFPPSLQHPGSFSVPAAAWAQTQSRRWWWRWQTLRSKWGRSKKRKRGAAWSSSPRRENGWVRWTADGWDALFRPAEKQRGPRGKWSDGVVSLLSCCDLCLPPVVQEAGVPQRHQLVWAQRSHRVANQRQLKVAACHHWCVRYK